MAKAKQVVDRGALGKLVAVMGSAVFFKPDQYFADAPWRREIGAGPILLNMIHEVHNLRMLCGDIVAVQAFASQAIRGFPVEDTVVDQPALRQRRARHVHAVRHRGVARAAGSRRRRRTRRIRPIADEDCYVVIGTFGSLSMPTMRLKTYPRAEDRSWWKPFEEGVVGMVRDDPLEHQIEHFGAVVRGEAKPLVSARDGLKNLRITEAIATAAKTGRAPWNCPPTDPQERLDESAHASRHQPQHVRQARSEAVRDDHAGRNRRGR